MTTTTDVLVIGAGPTGLLIACLLTRHGVNVRIVDKKVGLSEESRAIVVHAKTLELLDKLGLADQALAEGERLQSLQLLSEGKRAGTLTFLNNPGSKSTPYPFGLIYGQDQTEHLLLKHLVEVGGQVEWNTEVLSLEQRPDSVRVRVRVRDGGEESIEARWVVGADGAHSPVRHFLSLGFQGETYEQALFIADIDMEWGLEPRRGSMELARRGFFLFIPMRGKGRYRLFGALPPDLVARNSLTLDEVRRVLDTQSKEHITLLKMRWNSVYRTHHRIAERFRVGRVFLVGDAAHIHSPAGGQGMNTGIGDAFNLGWKLALVVKGDAHETLLDSYEAERIPFARSILRGSDLGFHIQASTNPVLQWLKVYVIPPLFRLLSPLPPAQRRFFWLLSQLWTSYRTSPAVVESGPVKQGPRAGERAPYGFFEVGPDAGQSIFTLLRDLDHHLFLFAGSKPGSTLTDLRVLEEHVRSLLDAYTVPIHLHLVSGENPSLHRLYGVYEPGVFLIRPDGHIAYRGRAEDEADLKSYLDGLFSVGAIAVAASEKPAITRDETPGAKAK